MPKDSDCRPEAGSTLPALPLEALIERVCAAVEQGEAEFTRLDRAIGDGDHGANLCRGARALRERAGELAALDTRLALRESGMALVLSVGGASGPLYGSFLIGVARAWGSGDGPASCLQRGLTEVCRRGRSDAGAKTLLDVLIPAVGQVPSGLDAVRLAADTGFEATRDMVATRGRAAYLGERSRGHCDPGAASARCIVHAVCDVMESIR